ncbi:TIGR03749 family integrating conjugative element protein [Pseudomonas sp. RW407]|uniref:TIGR03749 family integrating conjugative element protein n=1 Tax=Pseudomonas sp. RW407 TaxID=2202894 RepID=UPI000D6F1A89|nr:TIGR03749 family integrating conjugative element protein [Pseudomonas sp. RW407]PWU28664.1 TIGR03749 family integrating conjugative element protein [Pseudomonas sp. RW407]
MKILLRWGGALSFLIAVHAQAVEILQWERIPLAVPLRVGQERIVFVDQNVRVGMKPELVGKLRVQSTGGAIYLLANEPIPPSRLQLQNVANGEIMLVDIAATAAQEGQPALEPVKIVSGDTTPARYGQSTSAKPRNAAAATTAAEQEEDAPPEPHHETPSPVVLTRYAAQMLYAPLRTVEPVAGIAQVRIDRRIDLSTLLPVQPLEATALGAWKLDGYYVTAVKLRNTSTQQLKLDPRDLMGNFVAATFQHPYLGARGNATDTTTVYLITQGKGLRESLLPASISQVDPKGGQRGSSSER